MPDQTFMRAMRLAFTGCGGGLRDIVKGASGLAAYEQYLGHLRANHPEVPPMSREAFFRDDLTARWDGIRRCC